MPEHKLLLVDDETNIINSLNRLLRKDGYEIFTALSGKDGLEVIKNEKIALVISDQRMPVMNGAEFLGKVKNISPDTVRVMLTGYADITATMDAINKGEIFRYLSKPWDDMELKIVIKQALREYDLTVSNNRLNELTIKQNTELKELNEDLEAKVIVRSDQILKKNAELDSLNKDLEENFIESIRLFIGIIELIDPLLGSHSKRVAFYSGLIAKDLGIEEKEIETIEIASLLHDIGMVGIPKTIKDEKSSKINLSSKKAYMEHPIIGQKILSKVKRLDPIGTIIRFHHERYDGKGYPDKIHTSNIPIESRIIAVADFYDEITNKFESDIGNEHIKNILNDGKKKMFEPNIVNSLFNVVENLQKRA